MLFEESNANQWAMSRPMLPLILINPAFYEEYRRGFCLPATPTVLRMGVLSCPCSVCRGCLPMWLCSYSLLTSIRVCMIHS